MSRALFDVNKKIKIRKDVMKGDKNHGRTNSMVTSTKKRSSEICLHSISLV